MPDAAAGSLTMRSAHYVDAVGGEHDIVVSVAGPAAGGPCKHGWTAKAGWSTRR